MSLKFDHLNKFHKAVFITFAFWQIMAILLLLMFLGDAKMGWIDAAGKPHCAFRLPLNDYILSNFEKNLGINIDVVCSVFPTSGLLFVAMTAMACGVMAIRSVTGVRYDWRIVAVIVPLVAFQSARYLMLIHEKDSIYEGPYIALDAIFFGVFMMLLAWSALIYAMLEDGQTFVRHATTKQDQSPLARASDVLRNQRRP